MSGFQVTSRPSKPTAQQNNNNNNNHSSLQQHSPALRNSRTSPDLRSAEIHPPMIPNGSQVLVTLDIDAAYFVDLSASTSPAAIKERIYAKLGIYDDDHANYKISRCRAGQPVGQPLDDWQLWDMSMRATRESDPPMLIVINNSPPQQQPQPPYFPRNHSTHSSTHNNNNQNNQIHSPNSPDSHSHLKHDYRSSSAGSRHSPDPTHHHHLPPRSRWQRFSREHLQHARDGSSSSSSHPPLPPQSHSSSSTDIRNPPYNPTHQSPVTPSFPDDRRPSPNSNVPFEVPVYPNSRHPSRPQIETPEDWVRVQHPARLSPESSSPTKSRPIRRPSDPSSSQILPPISSSQPPLPSYADPRLAEYQRQLRSANPKNPSAAAAAAASTSTTAPVSSINSTTSARRFPQQPSQPPPPPRRGDLHSAKSMEELHHTHDPRKRTITGLNHPPLPTDSAVKIAASPASASRAPPPLRIARTDPNLQRPNQQPGRPSYPPQTSPSFPFPHPTINSHVRPSRPTGPPGYGFNASSSSGSQARIDPRIGPPTNSARPPPTTSASLSSRNPRVSLQIYEKRYLDQARPPPRPRTGDGSSPIRPSQFSDRQLQATVGPHGLQQVPGYYSVPLRTGEVLQEFGVRRRERDQSREYRTELEREPAQRRPNMASPTIGPSSASARSVRLEDQPDTNFLRSPHAAPLERSSRRPTIDMSRSRTFDPALAAASPSSIYPSQDAYGGFESESMIKQRTNVDDEQEHLSEHVDLIQPSKKPLSLTIPHQANARLTAMGRTERRLANDSPRTSDEIKPRDRGMGETSPVDLAIPLNQVTLDDIQIPLSTASEEEVLTDFQRKLSQRKPSRGRSATTASTSTGTLTSFASSSATNQSTTTSVTTPPPNNAKMFADFEDDDDDVVGTFVTPMQPYTETTAGKSEGLTKPKLSLQTDTSYSALQTPKSDFQIPRIREESAGEIPIHNKSTPSSSDVTQMEQVPPPGSSPTDNGNLKVLSTKASERDSRRISFTGDDWAVRPPIDAVYENLEDFFPHHDLDKPIDIGFDPPDLNSPSSPAPASGQQSPPGVGAMAPPLSASGGPSASALARLKGRTRSIRVVAQEKKRLLRRTEDKARAVPPRFGASDGLAPRGPGTELDSRGAALLRRKSTKLWGAKIEEVVPGDQVSIPSISEATMGDDANNFSFKWVKGELIGKGSFGQVYLALNATNGEMLAVKQVELPKTRSDRECERQKSVVNALKSEIHLMRDLEHPNIVQYLGFEETTVYLSIFLEYVSGGSIGRCLRRHGAFELNVIKYFTYQVLEGLKYLHGLHILHRDLKADNLLVDFSGICKISDFGISKKSEHVYEDNTQMSLQGSIFWMAPEVVHNPTKKGYSAKVDIWSLGCVVLEMFAGRRPWSDEEAIQAMFKLGAERLRPPVPPDVKLGRMSDHFLAQCFIVDPEARPTADRLTDHRFLEIENKAWRFEDSELYRSIRTPH